MDYSADRNIYYVPNAQPSRHAGPVGINQPGHVPVIQLHAKISVLRACSYRVREADTFGVLRSKLQ